MTAHTKEQREFIALRLARFDLPTDICAAFLATYADTACTLADVQACDPAKGAILAPETLEKFRAARARVMDDPASAPSADRRVRLIILHQELEFARARGATELVMSLLRQIADETGEGDAAPAAGGGEVKAITRTIVDPPAAVPT